MDSFSKSIVLDEFVCFVNSDKGGFVLLIVVKLVMDRIANRPRGFAFLKYKTEGESNKAAEGMHGKVNLSSQSHPSTPLLHSV